MIILVENFLLDYVSEEIWNAKPVKVEREQYFQGDAV
jgi:hypothetical protein